MVQLHVSVPTLLAMCAVEVASSWADQGAVPFALTFYEMSLPRIAAELTGESTNKKPEK